MLPQITIATIVVNYRSEQRTIRCISEELTRCTLPHRIIVVNNGATAATNATLALALNATVVDKIAQPIDPQTKIFIINTPLNNGFARGNNLGVEFVTTHFDVEYLLFSNNDIVLRSDHTIESLVGRLSTLPDVGIIGPKIVGLDGEYQTPYLYSSFWREMVMSQWGRFVPFYRGKEYQDGKLFIRESAHEGYYYRVMGSFFVAKTEVYIACGKMDPNTFLYGEEVILAERMLRIGQYNYYYPSVEILHEHGTTINNNRDLFRGRDYLAESLFYYYREYRGVSNYAIHIAKALRWIFASAQSVINQMERVLCRRS
ncbi:MAG: glycosyltransferase [Rikenellaceae bacterium]